MTVDSFENAMTALPNFLASSGLAVEDVPSWAYLNQFEVKMKLGHDKKRIVSDGIMIPYHDLHGQPLLVHGIPHMRIRLLSESWIEKNGDGKYRSRANTGSQLYVPRALRGLLNSGHPLVITEGEKKAESLCKAGIPCVGLGGVAMGRVRADSEDKDAPRLLIHDLVGVVAEYLAAASSDARVLVLFDSDGLPHATQSETADKDVSFKGMSKFVANTSVYFEALTLAKALREEFLGTRVGPAWCPDAVDGSKQGVDDWLMVSGADTVLPEIVMLAGGGSFTTAARVAASQQKEQLADQGGYVALGQSSDALAVWSKPGERVVLLTSAALSRQAEILRVTGADYALMQWPKITKEGGVSLDMLAAQVTIIRECQSKGFWIPSRERGGGVWLDQGELLINAASGLYHATVDGLTTLGSADRYNGEYIYPATGSYVIEPMALDTINAEDLSVKLGKHFKNWHWANRHDPLLMSGWILAQAYLGGA